MGFSIRYRSRQPIRAAEVSAIKRTAEEACEGRTWLSCEPPVDFSIDDEDGHLRGFSKPNFHPHPDDAASAAQEGLLDGTVRDLLDVLCRLSREHGIDWEISHDYSEGPIGFIRAGMCDVDVQTQVEILADIAEELDSLSDDEFFGRDMADLFGRGMDDESDDKEGPSILPFRPERD
jgi:hypothetical protein